MHIAARCNEVLIAALLLQRGGDIDLKHSRERTPLYFAVSYGALETVKFFLENGASTTSLMPKVGTHTRIREFHEKGWDDKPISEPHEQLSDALEQVNP
jgi:hypothetical protein